MFLSLSSSIDEVIDGTLLRPSMKPLTGQVALNVPGSSRAFNFKIFPLADFFRLHVQEPLSWNTTRTQQIESTARLAKRTARR